MSSKLSPNQAYSFCQGSLKAALFDSQLAELSQVKRWLIAHSGGLDSQCLLYLAAEILPTPPVVIHINHHLQTEADHWSAFSKRQAEALNLENHQFDVEPASTSEAAARDVRYQVFESFMQPGDCLLMAHHADDQAETLLFRMLRGAGLKGMSAIPSMRPLGQGILLRPLLACSRNQLEATAEFLQLTHVEDPSNCSDSYDRNYLRRNVIPLLQQRWPGFQQRWFEMAKQFRQADTLLNEYLHNELISCSDDESISIDYLQNCSRNRADALLRYWIESHSGVALNQSQLDCIKQEVILAQADAQPEYLLQRFRLCRYRQRLYLLSASPPIMEREMISTLSLGRYDLGDGVLLVTEGGGVKSLEGLSLRRRQGGERLHPYGRSGSVSVKKLLQEASIPPWLRGGWPLIFSNDELVAVPGIAVSVNCYQESAGFSLLWRSNTLSDNA